MKPAFHPQRQGFTLVEIMVVVAIIAMLATLAIPNYFRARKRSQASRMLNDLRMLDGAIDQYAMENGKPAGSPLVWTDVQTYLKVGTVLYTSGGTDLLGHPYGSLTVDSIPVVPAETFDALSDVAPASFWSPFK
jgi:prepilin-type N-terminal cleavage/methylation domain-containing protein